MGKGKNSRKSIEALHTEPSISRDAEVKYWENVWTSVQETASKSEENIDKKVFALSAGAIGLELTLLEVIGNKSIEWNWLAFLAAGCFVLALLLNLINHLYGRKTQSKQSKMIKDFIYEDKKALTTPEIYSRMERHSRTILRIHWAASISVIAGIVLLFVYSYLKLS